MQHVGIIGAGTMGAGIAQVAAAHGDTVALFDIDVSRTRAATASIAQRLKRAVDKGRMPAAAADATCQRIQVAGTLQDLGGATLVIEAVVEDLDVKVAVLKQLLDVVTPDAIFASNTSSLSITTLGRALGVAERCCGMHFFNPAPVMPLVEIIAGADTAAEVVQRVFDIACSWDKSAVRVKDTPGFIVNRVARPYYLEGLRIVEERLADPASVDLIMKEIGGFRMGPFELMDLVGVDVNYAVTCSVYEQTDRAPRFKPSEIQAQLVQAGQLGRKTASGFYNYQNERPELSYHVETVERLLPDDLRGAWEAIQGAGGYTVAAATGVLFARIVCSLMNEAARAADEGVATVADIDRAMQLGTNYPKGLLAWADEWGRPRVRRFLEVLNSRTPDGRFTPARRFCE